MIKKKKKKTSRARIVFFVRLVRARFVIAKPAASSIKWTMMTMMMMGRRATGARETKMSIRRLRVGVKDERLVARGLLNHDGKLTWKTILLLCDPVILLLIFFLADKSLQIISVTFFFLGSPPRDAFPLERVPQYGNWRFQGSEPTHQL